VQAVPQQIPSTQKALEQLLLVVHCTPLERLVVHTPALQKAPLLQSSSTLQSPLHCVPPQMYGVQFCVCSAGHRPVPVQLLARVATACEQLASRHCVVDPG
jgi:hypothetical protein